MNNLSPVGWALRPLKKYAVFSGRAPRAEYWWFVLLVILVYLALTFVMMPSLIFGTAESAALPTGSFGAFVLLLPVVGLVLLIPTIAVQVRRLHDIDRSGWWIGGYYALYAIYSAVLFGGFTASATVGAFVAAGVLAVLFMIYSVVLLVITCLPGTRGPNRYGPDPYGDEDSRPAAHPGVADGGPRL